jgi:cell division protein FtsI/penicillin-binding protein 2
VTQTGYSLTAHLPAGVLNGFDPAENPRIGLLVMVEDGELGQQSLTVGDELNWWIDPSMWPVGELRM